MVDRYILDLDGRTPIRAKSRGEWRRWALSTERHVADDRVGKVRVSTIFLGLDRNFDGEGLPLLFETMVFGGPLNNASERYSTWEEAEAGHAAMLARVKACPA